MTAFRLICLLFCLLGPVALPAQEAVTGPDGPIATESDARTDAGIAVRIREILQELGGYEDVTVTVAEGIVTFRGTTATLSQASALTALATRVEGVVAVKNEVTETTDIARRLNPALDRFETRLEQLWTAAPLLGIALAAFAAITFTGYLLSTRERLWTWLAPNSFIAGLYGQIVQIVFVIAGIVVALDLLDASALLGTILGAAGIFGLAIGFAVRDTVENYIASIMLSIRQPFRPNDTVEINGDTGKVVRLTSRATILLSFDGNQIRIPNATVFKSRIVNFSANPQMRFKFTLTVAMGSDIARARDLATATVAGLPYVLQEPAATAWIENVADRGIEIVVTGWIDQRETSLLLARGEALRLVKLAWKDAGIALAEAELAVRVTREDAPRAAAPAVPVRETRAVADVEAVTDSALDKMAEAVREDATVADYLTPEARKE